MSRTIRANQIFWLWTGIGALFALLLGGEVMGRIPLVAFAPAWSGQAAVVRRSSRPMKVLCNFWTVRSRRWRI